MRDNAARTQDGQELFNALRRGNVILGNKGDHKGFYAYWNDASGNPHDFEDAPTARGEPVNVLIELTDTSASTGKPTVRRLTITAKPQN